ncbi:hypothetical protein [Verrucomicrobium spinosum]|uniref:hypothetical protein n=1 Tax=Verrucomicrobium spinosum TaxID=2736 RepID=UPI000AD063BD|nr:hypothetical protein [Verrucomicrobium spinosum]
MITTGFRNEYDAAFNRQGDLFTYDADMEWDFSVPWYRPTRVCMVQSGGEFGWRSLSKKWPVRWEDSLPPVTDIGLVHPQGWLSGMARSSRRNTRRRSSSLTGAMANSTPCT